MNSGVISRLASPLMIPEVKSVPRQREPQMKSLARIASSSTTLSGQILTPERTILPRPIRHSSLTIEPSSTLALVRISVPEPMTLPAIKAPFPTFTPSHRIEERMRTLLPTNEPGPMNESRILAPSLTVAPSPITTRPESLASSESCAPSPR